VDAQDDPEARIRELERPLSETAAWSEMGAPTRRATGGFRGPRFVFVLVVIGLASLGFGVAIFFAQRPGGGSSLSTSARPSGTTSRTVTAANQSVQRLYGLLPHGYNAKNCSPVSSPNRQALATLQCGQTADPHGPASAAFSLYPDAAALTDAFQNGIGEDTITQCPNGNQSPGTWANDASPNVTAGAVLCGKYNDRPDLMWTNTHDLLLSDIQGPDLVALYQFWQNL
jgi:serine/threonine-protein kinase